ncbi:copper transporting ATPase [Spiroplasma turonicum]|uniref:Copper transporting ATPase n=2 Tax=Spiroplasma turonicum TaxID=216946 RepID=A0A0K1P7Q0_9MOLU|nr:heavy metal translocating P-type ATPase [Spiroplasma turonicum]AKU79912.1 copper transporting ATPase [Spiroplasma turonicum]
MIVSHYYTKNIFSTIFYNKYFLFSIAIFSTYIYGFNFIKKTYYELFVWRKIGMNLLIFISTQTAFIYSSYQLAINNFPELIEVNIFVVLFVKTGDIINNKLRKLVSKDLKSLISLIPNEVITVVNNTEKLKKLSLVKENELVKVLKDQVIPIDGFLVSENRKINTQIIDGENNNKTFFKHDTLFAGMINKDIDLIMKSTTTIKNSFLTKIINKVALVQSEKTKLQTIIDKIIIWFTPLIILLAICGFVLSYLVLNYGNIYIAIKIAITILVTACPCSLGIAIPLAIMIGSLKAAKKNIIFNKPDAFEKLIKINVIAFDKTGTLTKGEVKVVNFIGDESFLEILWIIESNLTHPLADGILNYIRDKNLIFNKENNFKKVNRFEFILNNKNYKLLPISKYSESFDKVINFDINKLENTTTFLIENDVIVCLIEFKDKLRENVEESIQKFKSLGLEVFIITGDNKKVSEKLGLELKVDKVYYEKTIEEKLDVINNIQKQNKKVLYVGDGMNDILAIQKADLSISIITNSSFLNLESDVSLLNPNIWLIYESFKLAKFTKKIIITNLFWAFIYNSIVIPLAIFSVLTPMIGMALMFLSSFLVLLNSFILKNLRL